ncbi:CPBP family intramembrane metalloprotease [Photobacterium phosphoreum]|uniref:type II CAAX endopeptidase family protein n=1 Tax=Photobacterium phosphoreum TaxID=659 RepID=UPI001E2F9F5C|nr:type II CAAX endopeptidase family protein [Photobacterium phosphoreum]MCD9504589.1 CPBP family intramembrane metalloprotease [Photobacterium phosphoreum]
MGIELNKGVQNGLSVVLVAIIYSVFLSGIWNPGVGYYLWIVKVIGESSINESLIMFATYARFIVFAFVAYVVYRFFYQDNFIGNMPKRKLIFSLFFSVFSLYFISFVFFEFETFTLNVANSFNTGTLKDKALLICTYLIMIPIFEEVFFRGIMMGAILKISFLTNEKVRMVVACIIPSLLFITLHTQYEYVWTYILLFLFAIIVSVARAISNGLLLPILLHSFAIVCAVGFSFLLL